MQEPKRFYVIWCTFIVASFILIPIGFHFCNSSTAYVKAFFALSLRSHASVVPELAGLLILFAHIFRMSLFGLCIGLSLEYRMELCCRAHEPRRVFAVVSRRHPTPAVAPISFYRPNSVYLGGVIVPTTLDSQRPSGCYWVNAICNDDIYWCHIKLTTIARTMCTVNTKFFARQDNNVK